MFGNFPLPHTQRLPAFNCRIRLTISCPTLAILKMATLEYCLERTMKFSHCHTFDQSNAGNGTAESALTKGHHPLNSLAHGNNVSMHSENVPILSSSLFPQNFNVCSMYILVSRLRGRSKKKLRVHKLCSTGQRYSTGHQTGFIVGINSVRTRQEISKHTFIAYNMLH